MSEIAPMEQLLAFCDFERQQNPGRKHVAEWAAERIEADAAELRRLQAEVEALKKTGPVMQRGELDDGSPWMGTMLDVLDDYKLAVSLLQTENDALRAKLAARPGGQQ